jgi:hypothetical protein
MEQSATQLALTPVVRHAAIGFERRTDLLLDIVLLTGSQLDRQRIIDDAKSRLANRTKVSNSNRADRVKKKRIDRNYFGSSNVP